MLHTIKNVLTPILEKHNIKNIKLYKADKSFTINKQLEQFNWLER